VNFAVLKLKITASGPDGLNAELLKVHKMSVICSTYSMEVD
jgi:hypothetical protein